MEPFGHPLIEIKPSVQLDPPPNRGVSRCEKNRMDGSDHE